MEEDYRAADLFFATFTKALDCYFIFDDGRNIDTAIINILKLAEDSRDFARKRFPQESLKKK